MFRLNYEFIYHYQIINTVVVINCRSARRNVLRVSRSIRRGGGGRGESSRVEFSRARFVLNNLCDLINNLSENCGCTLIRVSLKRRGGGNFRAKNSHL